VSGNSSSGGASGFNRPFLSGCTVEWDAEGKEWVATSDASPDRVFRGRSQDELDAARGRLVAQLGQDLLDITHYAATHGYTPPQQP